MKDKSEYYDKADKDKERYNLEMDEYKRKSQFLAANNFEADEKEDSQQSVFGKVDGDVPPSVRDIEPGTQPKSKSKKKERTCTSGPQKIARAQYARYYYLKAMKEKNGIIGKKYDK